MDKKKIKELENTLKAAKEAMIAEEKFKKLPAAKKRVAIAQDVIASLRSKQLLAKTGDFVMLDDELDEDFQVALLKGQECTVCALGGLFTCAVKFKNKVDTYDAGSQDRQDIKDYLRGIFSSDQLGLIESAFETENWMDEGDDEKFVVFNEEDMTHEYVGILKRAIDFGERYSDDTKRMIAIMQNIIENEGTFKP